jgi:ATP-dependent DNA helicase DinG
MTNLLLSFPDEFTPNGSQVSILKKIEKTVKSGKKFIVCNAPTGAGKSFISATISNSLNGPSDNFVKCVDNYSIFSDNGESLIEDEDPFGCYTLTITKSLQDQYTNTFSESRLLKGQNNHQCSVDNNVTVDVAPCNYVKNLKNDCWKSNICPYYNSRNIMLKSKFAILNYSMFFSLPEHLKRRKVIICDEGSELEEQLVNQFTCEINIPFLVSINTKMTSFPVEETPTKVLEWLNKLASSLNIKVEEFQEYFRENKSNTLESSKKKVEFSKLNNIKNNLEVLIYTFNESNYLIEKINKTIKFTPLKVDKLAQYIFNHADHIIIMSATIIDHKNYCKSLGIEDYEYIETESVFDPEKGPIYILKSQKINFQNMKEMLPKLVGQVEGILNEHSNDKGIIHTHTQYIADYINQNVESDRLLCREAGVRNEDILSIHESSTKPTVLVSPSMSYGVDLKGDLAKFQIILKAPWLPTKDVRVEKLMKIDKNWYSNKMLCSLVQACGRGIRSVDDECITYILDGSIYDAIQRNKSKLPKFFLDRFQ